MTDELLNEKRLLRSRLQSQAIVLWEIEILMVQADVDKYAGLFRQVARRAAIGRALLRVKDFRATGVQATLKKAYAKHVLLPRIFEARPMSSRSGLEVHMLLNHRGCRREHGLCIPLLTFLRSHAVL